MTDPRHHYGAVERLARTDPAALIESMTGMRSSLLTAAAELLGRHAAADVAVPVLVHLSRHGDAIVREGALRGLRYHVADARAVEALRAMRGDVVLALRMMATRAVTE